MSKKQFKSQASSGRLGGNVNGFGGFGSTHSSPLSYIQEPLDFSSISDGNVIVSLKNLSKKDSTTKARALEEIQAYISKPDSDIDEALLEAWTTLFPRLSIDSARRVRQLAHNLNGSICVKCGKRAARHLPRIAGPWLAGCHDSDRAASKAAQDALHLVFSSPEKTAGLKQKFHGSILEYCRDAALNETTQTLSDERAVSKDDAEATYARVLATSLAVITGLLKSLPEDEIAKQESLYEEVLGETKLWELACHSDAVVRKSFHRLVQVAVAKQPLLVEARPKVVSTIYVYKGLPSDQTSSAADFVATLTALTTRLPSIWTYDYSGKKAAASRLKQFFKHGSRSGPVEFWTITNDLLARIPQEVWSTKVDEVKDLLFAARDGVASRDERFNASAAWQVYYSLLSLSLARLPSHDQESLVSECAMPIIQEYLKPSRDTAEWTLHGGKTAHLVAGVSNVSGVLPVLERSVSELASHIVEAAKMSQPQSSKDFEKSQLHVASMGERWAALQRELDARDLPDTLKATLLASDIKIVKECHSLLVNRDGKPYGAGAVIEELVRTCGPQLLKDVEFRNELQGLLQTGNSGWVLWPSMLHLVPCLHALAEDSIYRGCLEGALHVALAKTVSAEECCRLVHELFPRKTPKEAVDIAKANSGLQDFVLQNVKPGLGELQRTMFTRLSEVGALSDDTRNKALAGIVAGLTDVIDDQNLTSTMDFLTAMDSSTLKELAASSTGDQLVPNLIRLEQHQSADIAQKAANLSTRLSTTNGHANTNVRFGVVLQNLEHVSQKSMPMDALAELLDRVLGNEKKVQSLESAFPDLQVWRSSLLSAVRAPKPSLALLSPLGATVQLVQDSETRGSVQVDSEGLSQALRIAMYVTRLLSAIDRKAALAEYERQWDVLALLYVTTLIAEDNLSVLGTNALWHPGAGADAEAVVLEYVSEVHVLFSEYWETMQPTDMSEAKASSTNYSHLVSAIRELADEGSPQSPLAYYSALAFSKVTSNLFEVHGHSVEQVAASETGLRTVRAKKDTLQTTSYLIAHQAPLAGSATSTRLCNELVADLTALGTAGAGTDEKSLEQLIMLNAMLQSQPETADTIAKQRLMFFVKKLIETVVIVGDYIIQAEICKVLSCLFPAMADMYGEHWSQVLEYLHSTWSTLVEQSADETQREQQTLLTHGSLKLLATLRRVAVTEDPNDDLVDALKEKQHHIYTDLVAMLKSANGTGDEQHQPALITHEQLARQLSQSPYVPLDDSDELFPLLYTPSRAIQQGAFDLLHRQIPAGQEQLSLDVALDNKKAHLPDELLSLILEAPTLDSLVDASFDRTMPLSLQGYLYSWRLLFDHFSGSSYRVKTDYIDQLKEGAYLPGLLSFTFDFLGHSRGKPVDASRFDIETYVADSEPSPERDVQWLLTHLFYLSLTNLPSLVKSYYLDIRSRQTSLAVESWTSKFISPLIVNDSLQSVAEWAEKGVKEDPEYEKMNVKVGMRSKEINVSYVVDEQTMAIKVILPEAYPLAAAQVVGVSRVAVKEDKWQSWLRNCQGVITFSNGSITDGLSAWRKNVTGALKGQSECAICYSIIDSTKQLPTKRCPTCKHLFHGNCLFKWFKSSNASTCPLCRNPFNFS
ncbi:hypothetical protein LTR62_002431 [Meristemomyces frigidus]|uniref:E3 ubiquitin-protein ligase listerin n=1 Tax=Meristemomyces frigidus TaxID=1508187 RepID=A0AAN7TM61_9PEZI|nr:hypothetical protein LTR62_002431 [Meristemomyces frigidus]